MSLSTILSKTKNEINSKRIVDIPIEKIIPNPSQPRKYFNSSELISMAKSISQIGIIQPLIVQQIENGSYQLTAGERRLRAAKLAGLETVPCIISEISDKNSALIALIENLQRSDLNFFEQAEGFKILIERFDMTQQEAAIHLGITQPTIANKLRLLNLSNEQRAIILNYHLTERHARALLRIEESKRENVLNTICEKHLTAEETEHYINDMIKNGKIKKSYQKRSVVLSDVKLFFNTVEKAVNIMRLAGVDAKTEKIQEDDYIEYVIKIPNKKANNVE